jgi:NADH dehydrogenase (ubiquinone) Fe-S protein 2
MSVTSEQLKRLRQCLNKIPTGPVKVDDHKLVPPPRASMKESMESLIHHFKVKTSPPFTRDRLFSGSTDLFRGIFCAPRRNVLSHRSTQRRNGRLFGFVSRTQGCHLTTAKRLFFHFHSDGTNRPYRCSIRAPGFAHLAGADFMMRRECPLRNECDECDPDNNC